MNVMVEINAKFKPAQDTIATASGTLMITPPLDEDYWVYRVKLKHGQAIIGFPKFGMIGCGFALETDWNTNLPITCNANEIYEHIKHNKRFADITKQECLAAIKAIQNVAEVRA